MIHIKHKQKLQTIGSALLWVLVWQCASMVIGEELFLPSPLSSITTLCKLAFTAEFWQSISFSLLRIGTGFFLALFLGILLAWAASFLPWVEILLRPFMLIVKATPVASFIILALVWVSSRNLSVLISFLMVLPVIYSGTLGGIEAADSSMLEMAQVFRLGLYRKIRGIYLPALWPSLRRSADVALGLCWKSGIAAEVIGQVHQSIGGRLYAAKIYLLTPELFSWTAVIILVSWLFGQTVLWLLSRLHKAAERRWIHG